MRSKIKSTLLVMLTSLIMSCSTPTHKPETTTPTTQIPRLYCLERIYNQQFPITSRDEFFESINRLVEYREAQYLGAFHSQNPFLSLSLSYPLFESCVQELSDIGISEGYLIVPLDSVLLDTIAREEAIREAFFGEKAEIEREFFLMSADLGIGSLGRVFEVATSLDDIYTNISDGLTSYDKFVIGAIIVDFIPGVETDLFKGRFLQLLKKHGVLVGVRKGDGLYDFYSILRGAEPNVTKYSVLLGRVQKTNSSLEEAALAVEEAIIGAQSVRVEIGSGNRLGFLGHLDDPKLKTPTLRIGLERSSGVLRT
ncbi:MAG: hypothetical protein NZ893_00845, partial [Candidatus Aenigmarchaeota archaeon]|nr:hypothetical protein [Candidatus Aenigmarchaeota archaeon]